MKDKLTGLETLVYDGRTNPNLLAYYANNLGQGKTFGFRVKAWNFNGAGAFSLEAIYKSCTAPSGLDMPIVGLTTKTSAAFTWKEPTSNGACPISTYDLLLDDGNGGAFTPRDAAAIGNKHYLRSHSVTFTSAESTKTFRYRLRATNEIGSIESPIGNQIVAGIPLSSTVAPVADLT
jgi:hypothetical protein